MEIKPTYISFEQAKWLKEKAFEIDTEEVLFYRDEINNIEEHQIKNRDVIYNGSSINYKVDEDEYRTYHQWEVCEWLRVNHGIWVYVKRGCKIINNEAFDKFQPIIEFIPQVKFDITNIPVFDLPQEAYSAAFDYIKDNNLI
jgi:hypothetical protein